MTQNSCILMSDLSLLFLHLFFTTCSSPSTSEKNTLNCSMNRISNLKSLFWSSNGVVYDLRKSNQTRHHWSTDRGEWFDENALLHRSVLKRNPLFQFTHRQVERVVLEFPTSRETTRVACWTVHSISHAWALTNLSRASCHRCFHLIFATPCFGRAKGVWGWGWG